MLKDFINLCTAMDGTPGTVLHVGAGLGDELPVFEQLNFEHIHLIEANPELAENLAAKTSGIANVEVHKILVAGDDEIKMFYRTNNPRFDSLKKPSALCKFYPNLEILNEYTVRAQSLNSFLQQYPLDANKNNLLVLETKGAELDILQKTNKESLQQFAWIVIKTSSQALYEQAAQSIDMEPALEAMDFELSTTQDLHLPFLVQVFTRNDAKVLICEIKVLICEIKELKRVSNVNSKLLVKAQADNDSLRKKYREKVDSEQALIKMIEKLRDRLQAAADFYGRLEKDHPEIVHQLNRVISDSGRD